MKELVKGLKILEQAVAHLNDSYELKKTDLAAYNLGRSMLHASQPCEAAKVFMQVLDFSLEHEGGSKLSRLELAKRAWESLAQIPAGCNSGE
ncbi:MAG: hypothetical protein COW42_01530 [Deltaproteobacteria bacterium CG17_big_fil_post_rev_8_21_14_2_50_63_7]|nr:MAG: hypothetical protein COW42_01530 [Deltaproteobacteria bacterium CG17_big_fil_post_rev_8_21_14_2_50_63_7]